jgi:hypothetical protein
MDDADMSNKQQQVFTVCAELRARGLDPTYSNVLPIMQQRGQGMSGRDLQPILTAWTERQIKSPKVRAAQRVMRSLTQRERRAVLRAVKASA